MRLMLIRRPPCNYRRVADLPDVYQRDGHVSRRFELWPRPSVGPPAYDADDAVRIRRKEVLITLVGGIRVVLEGSGCE